MFRKQGVFGHGGIFGRQIFSVPLQFISVRCTLHNFNYKPFNNCILRFSYAKVARFAHIRPNLMMALIPS